MRIQNRSPFRPRSALPKMKVENKATAKEATVYIYDEIGYFGVVAEDFVKEINAITAETIHIRFNTPGGSVFDGTAMYNVIKNHKSRTVAHIDGLAASISSVIALAADDVQMAENAFLMIHEPWSIVIGDSATMREEADLLDKVGSTIVNTYVNKTEASAERVKELMLAETWMSADEALEMGFIDGIEKTKGGEEKAKASLFDLAVFANVPDQLKSDKQPPTARELEHILKESGYSNKQAKEILANGFQDSQRDVDEPEITLEASGSQRDVELTDQRDVDAPKDDKEKAVKSGSTEDLILRAKMITLTN
jgi:ATP-dependent Clp protease, protease subunit